MYIDLRPDAAPAPDDYEAPATRCEDDAAGNTHPDSPTLPPRTPGDGARGAADEERPALRTLRIFRVLMDD